MCEDVGLGSFQFDTYSVMFLLLLCSRLCYHWAVGVRSVVPSCSIFIVEVDVIYS